MAMVVADANKTYVLEHHSVLDDLVAGLLVDDDNPRREQDCADKLQATCVLALEVSAR